MNKIELKQAIKEAELEVSRLESIVEKAEEGISHHNGRLDIFKQALNETKEAEKDYRYTVIYKTGYMYRYFENGEGAVRIPAQNFVRLSITGDTTEDEEHIRFATLAEVESFVRHMNYGVATRQLQRLENDPVYQSEKEAVR